MLACQHITPDYRGTVYQVRSAQVKTFICPDCVVVEGVVLQDAPFTVMDNEIWNDIACSLHIVDMSSLRLADNES